MYSNVQRRAAASCFAQKIGSSRVLIICNTYLELSKSQRAVEKGKKEKTGCKIICGAPTTLAVKGLMMMMMMNAYRLLQIT